MQASTTVLRLIGMIGSGAASRRLRCGIAVAGCVATAICSVPAWPGAWAGSHAVSAAPANDSAAPHGVAGDQWDAKRLFSADYSVVSALEHRMGVEGRSPVPRYSARVDVRLGPGTVSQEGVSFPGLEEGVVVDYEAEATDLVYQDKHGARLILRNTPRCSVLILSTTCKHAGKLVRRDLRGLRTESGVGLGDTKKRVLKRLGAPSRRDSFEGYEILWYIGRPRHVVREKGAWQYDEGHDAAYALRKGNVMEIWLEAWDTAAGG